MRRIGGMYAHRTRDDELNDSPNGSTLGGQLQAIPVSPNWLKCFEASIDDEELDPRMYDYWLRMILRRDDDWFAVLDHNWSGTSSCRKTSILRSQV